MRGRSFGQQRRVPALLLIAVGAVSAAAGAAPADLEAARAALARGEIEAAIAAADRAGARSLSSAAALLIRGRARLRQSRFEEAVADLSGAVELDPEGEVGAAAQMELGPAVLALGDVVGALKQLQRVRDVYVEQPAAAAVLGLISTIYRVRFREPAQGSALQFDAGFAAGSRLDRPVGLEVVGAGDLFIADDKADRVARFDPQGLPSGEISIDEPLALFVEPDGSVGVVAKKAVRTLGDSFQPVALKDGKRDALDNLVGGARLASGDLLLLDSKAKIALRFDANRAYLEAFAPGFSEPSAAAVDRFGRVALLSQKRRAIGLFDGGGGQVAALVPGASFSEPVAIAYDRAGDLFVLDRTGPKVALFDAALRPVGKVVLHPEYREPVALALGSDGALFVLDGKRKLVTRYQ